MLPPRLVLVALSSPSVTGANIAIIQCGEIISVVWNTAPVLATRRASLQTHLVKGRLRVCYTHVTESLLGTRSCCEPQATPISPADGFAASTRRSAKW